MKITVEDDRPAFVPVLVAGLIAGLAAVLAQGAFVVAGASSGGLVTLLSIGIGLLVGLFSRSPVERAVESIRG